jgi:3-oxoadipate enol-lactonase
MPTLHRDDNAIYYEVRGSGPRLLLCNGSGATIAGTELLIDALAKHFEVAVHDQRCLGRSSIPDAQPTMADYGADALALLDQLGWDTANVFGISFGGMVALELAVTHPQRIDRLALLCTSAGGAGGSSYPLHDLATWPLDERIAQSIRNMDTRFTDEWLATHPFDQRLVDNLIERSRAPKDDETRRGELLQLEARAHHDVWERLDRITCPTFVACGATDGQAPPTNSEAIHRRIASSELHVYDGGHLFVWQDRTALPEITAFLRG